jgi:hypothetical protein
MIGARLVFAFSEGDTHELWGMPGLAGWAMSIGACVAIDVSAVEVQ